MIEVVTEGEAEKKVEEELSSAAAGTGAGTGVEDRGILILPTLVDSPEAPTIKGIKI